MKSNILEICTKYHRPWLSDFWYPLRGKSIHTGTADWQNVRLLCRLRCLSGLWAILSHHNLKLNNQPYTFSMICVAPEERKKLCFRYTVKRCDMGHPSRLVLLLVLHAWYFWIGSSFLTGPFTCPFCMVLLGWGVGHLPTWGWGQCMNHPPLPFLTLPGGGTGKGGQV